MIRDEKKPEKPEEHKSRIQTRTIKTITVNEDLSLQWDSLSNTIRVRKGADIIELPVEDVRLLVRSIRSDDEAKATISPVGLMEGL